MKMCHDHCTLQYDLKLCSSAVQTELEALGYLNLGEMCEDPPSRNLAQCMPEVVRLSIEEGSERPNSERGREGEKGGEGGGRGRGKGSWREKTVHMLCSNHLLK